jgi:hypothetical protein
MRCLPLALIALLACGGKKDAPVSDTKAQMDSSFKQAVAELRQRKSSGHKYGPPTGKIRVANMLDLGGQPSGPVDLYDIRNPDSTTAPLIANLAYGQLSDYVSPRGADPGYPSNLYVFAAGTKTPQAPFNSSIDNSGFKATDQMTIALGPSKILNGLAFPAIAEAGERNPHWIDSSRAVPAGQALLIGLQANVSADSLPYFYLVVDGACPIATNDPRAKIPMALGTEQHYLVTPGSHTIGLVTAPSGINNCTGKTPVGTSTVTVTAGQRYIVFVYGRSSDGYKTLTAPIVAP